MRALRVDPAVHPGGSARRSGPPIPLYIAGARVDHIYPMSLLLPKSGLNVTVFSYCGQVEFGFTVDPELVPDPWSLAEGIPVALMELKERIPEPREAPCEARPDSAQGRPRKRRLAERSRSTSRRTASQSSARKTRRS